jgi:hypothetical protein
MPTVPHLDAGPQPDAGVDLTIVAWLSLRPLSGLFRMRDPLPPLGWLFLITQQFSLRAPNLQAVPVDYEMIWTQGFGGFER